MSLRFCFVFLVPFLFRAILWTFGFLAPDVGESGSAINMNTREGESLLWAEGVDLTDRSIS